MESTGQRKVSLQAKMGIGFLVGLVAGLAVNMTQPDAPWVDAFTTYVTGPIGQIFLRLLFMLVIPLLFSALVVGISEMGEVRSLRRVGLRTLAYTSSTCSSRAPASTASLPRACSPNPPAGPARSSAPAPSSRPGSTPSSASFRTISSRRSAATARSSR